MNMDEKHLPLFANQASDDLVEEVYSADDYAGDALWGNVDFRNNNHIEMQVIG